MRLITRRQWGADPVTSPASRNITPSRGGVVIHWEGTTLGGYDTGGAVLIVRRIQRFHIVGRGWADIAYNLLVDRHGRIFEGRGIHRRSAANGTTSGNLHYYAVCALAGPGDPITGELLHGLRDAVQYLRQRGGAGPRVVGHRDLYATDCPGDRLQRWLHDGMPIDGQPAPSVPAWPGRYLTYPPVMRGDDVRAWQTQMRRRGWSVTADGVYGPASRDTCRAFQKEKRLTVDGIVGPQTWRAAWTAPTS